MRPRRSEFWELASWSRSESVWNLSQYLHSRYIHHGEGRGEKILQRKSRFFLGLDIPTVFVEDKKTRPFFAALNLVRRG